MSEEYRFVIDESFTPETLPMARMAEYVRAVAELLGEPASVHFVSVEAGSVALVSRIDRPAQPKVRERLDGLRRGTPQPDVSAAFHVLDELLRRDNATGSLKAPDGARIIEFPGRRTADRKPIGPIRQEGCLDGQLIRVGGKDDTVPIHLRDQDTIHTGLYATPEMARAIAPYLLGPQLRVHGVGAWTREVSGAWTLRRFQVERFEVLEDLSLAETVAALRAVRGSHWGEVDDPVQDLLAERSRVGGSE